MAETEIPQYPSSAYTPTTTPTLANGQTITQYMASTANAGVLSPSQTLTPVLQQAQANEFEQNPGLQGDVTAQAGQAQAGQVTTAASAGGTTVNSNSYKAGQGSGTYNPYMINAAQGQVNKEDTVQGQYESLMDFKDGEVPGWAAGAVRAANEAINKRGLSTSTVAGSAITSALMEAALPIAKQDASVYATMNLQNLQNRQQALLSNQAAQNAAAQFNAQSSAQVEQFFSNLRAGIESQNASRVDAAKQFYASEQNKASITNATLQTQVSEANAQRQTAISQFNAGLKDARDKFNVENQRIIEQSNVAWRRSINTANTAAQNAANNTNVQNSFNMSQQAVANLWQQWRDEASWVNTASQNSLSRATQIAMVALNREAQAAFLDDQQEGEFYQALGAFGANLLGQLI